MVPPLYFSGRWAVEKRLARLRQIGREGLLDLLAEEGLKLPQNDFGFLLRKASTLGYTLPDREHLGQIVSHPLLTVPKRKPEAKLEFWYKTAMGVRYPMAFSLFRLGREEVPTIPHVECLASCRQCLGSGGGCPGFAPYWEKLWPSELEWGIVSLHTDFSWAMAPYKNYVESGGHPLPYFFPLSLADSLTEGLLKRILHKTPRVLATGGCWGCKPSSCTVLQGGPCSHPDRRTFSMEAVGVDCSALHRMLYGAWLPWAYRKTEDKYYYPQYVSRYAGVAGSQFDEDALLDAVMSDKGFDGGLREFIPYPFPEMEGGFQLVPSGVHKGDYQEAYSVDYGPEGWGRIWKLGEGW